MLANNPAETSVAGIPQAVTFVENFRSFQEMGNHEEIDVDQEMERISFNVRN